VNHRDEPGTTLRDRVPALTLESVGGELLKAVSLTIGPAEIVGVTGLADSGHLDLPDLLAGLQPRTAGRMSIDGHPYNPANPHDALQCGVGVVPSDPGRRRASGRHEPAREPVSESFPQADHSPTNRRGSLARRLLVAGGIKPPDPDAEISTLSGGNQQKVLVARWPGTRPRLARLGRAHDRVDIGARNQIYDQIRQQRG